MLKVAKPPDTARAKEKKPPRTGKEILFPKDIEARYDISAVSRWKWECAGKLPPRDVWIGNELMAWRLLTIEAAERGPKAREAIVTTAPP